MTSSIFSRNGALALALALAGAGSSAWAGGGHAHWSVWVDTPAVVLGAGSRAPVYMVQPPVVYVPVPVYVQPPRPVRGVGAPRQHYRQLAPRRPPHHHHTPPAWAARPHLHRHPPPMMRGGYGTPPAIYLPQQLPAQQHWRGPR